MKINSLLANNASVVHKANTLLRSGNKYITLVSKSGELTPAGRYYQQQTGTPLEPAGYNLTQTPVREGNTEFVTLRSGRKVKKRAYGMPFLVNISLPRKAMSFTNNFVGTMW